MDLTELLEYLAEGLVDDPEQVSVERFEEADGTVVLELAVGPDDYGKVIGRGGRTAQALRTVIAAAAGRRQRARRHRRLGAPVAVIGVVGRPHGLDGSFYVGAPRAALLREGAVVTLAGAQRTIVRRAGTDARPILRLEGAGDRDCRRGAARPRARGRRRGAPAAGPRRVVGRGARGRARRRRRARAGRRAAPARAARRASASRSSAPAAGPTCSSRSCATRSARSTSRRRGSTSTRRSSGEP